MLLRLLTDFFLVSPATFVPWTHLLPPSLFPSPATDLVPSTSKGKFLCFPATLLAVRELLLGAIRSKTWARRRRRRRRSAHYSYHSAPVFLLLLPSFIPSCIPAFPSHLSRNQENYKPSLQGHSYDSYLLVLYSLPPHVQSDNAITLSLITLQKKELKRIPVLLVLVLVLVLFLFPSLLFSSLLCFLLPKPRLHIFSFHGLYGKKKKPKLTPSFSISLSLSLAKLPKKKWSDNRRAAASSSSSSSCRRECACRRCCSCLGTQTVSYLYNK